MAMVEGTKRRKTKHLHHRIMGGIPDDLVPNILVTLPAKSLVRFKCVSKWWRNLITSHDFAKQNFNQATSKSNVDSHRIILSSFDSILSIKYDYNNVAVERIGYPFKTNHKTTTKVLGSCNGLICLARFKDWRPDSSILFWNPCTGFQFEVVDKFAHNACGFGYDKCSDDYKLVLIRYSSAVDVYSLKAKTWHTTTNRLPLSRDIFDDGSNGRGTFVDGMLYWISRGRTHVIRFDLEDEKFELVLTPERITWNVARLGVSRSSDGSSSCLLIVAAKCDNIHETAILQVWKLLDYNDWNKLMRIPISSYEGMCSSIVPALCYCESTIGNGKVLVVHPARYFCRSYRCRECRAGNSVFWVYDLKTGAFQRQVCDLSYPAYEQGTTHVHTLVSPNSY